jgi:hypothetical protein
MRDAIMLLYDYLDVLNAAMVHNPDVDLIRDLQRLGEQSLDGAHLAVRVVPDEAQFAIRFNGKSFAMMPEEPPAPLAWRAERSYLERVLDDPARYIDHPEKLDWEWLRAACRALGAQKDAR